jgi:hypothetical protein
MPAISRNNRANKRSAVRQALASRRRLLKRGMTLTPVTRDSKNGEIECFQRFVDQLSDEDYRAFRREKRSRK